MNLIDSFAEKLTTKYERTTERFTLVLHTSRNSVNSFPTRMSNMTSFLDSYREDMLKEYVAYLRDALLEIATEAHRQAKTALASDTSEQLPAETPEHVAALADYVLHQVIAQTIRDAALLVKELQGMELEVAAIMRTRKIPVALARALYIQKQPSSPAFEYIDKLGRRMSSARFVHGMLRMTALTAHNESVIRAALDSDITEFTVIDMDTNARIGSMDIESYINHRDDVFHPNARRVIGLEKADV